MPFFVSTLLLYVPPHQRQLAYNSTAHGRSQHISVGFSEVGHLPFFAAIVRIVPIICAILVFRACVGNLLYLKRNWRLLPQTLDVHYLHFTAVSSRSLPPPIKAGRFPLAQNLVKLSRSLNRLLRKKSPISPFPRRKLSTQNTCQVFKNALGILAARGASCNMSATRSAVW